MATPQTLLQMAGVTPAPPPVEDSALVLIDCQREYAEGALVLPGVEAALDEAARLLAFAREAGIPVIHIRHKGRPGGLFGEGGETFEICDAVDPQVGEILIDKTLPNAFAGTTLDDHLKEIGRKHLIVAGFMTHMCVSSTVRSALDHGYMSTVVADACATRDLPDGPGGVGGGVIAAADLHRAELAALSDRFATVLKDTAAVKG
jgi:nicotinamidase-related amidase